MIVLGNKFDGTNYEIEDTRTNEKVIANKEELIIKLK